MPTSRKFRRAAQADADVAPLDVVRGLADALCRAASECAHQHDRFAHLLEAPSIPAEELAAQEMCGVCDHTLAELAAQYEAAAATVRPEHDDDWWRRANALWHASREYSQRHLGCDRLTQQLGGKHSPQELWNLEIEFELEASAMLALRHACEAYRKARLAAAPPTT